MARRLRMSAELGDWLAELSTSEPASASEVGAALTATMNADDPTALALVGPPAADEVDPREEVDHLYQSMLEVLQGVRRHVAGVASDRKHWAIRVEEAVAAGQPDEVLAQLRSRLTEIERRESALTERSQRMQSEVGAFRAAKESAKAMYTAAEATVRIHEAIDAATGQSSGPDADDAARHAQALAAAEANLRAVATRADQVLRNLLDERGGQAGEAVSQPPAPQPAGQRPRPPVPSAAGLLELRADPLGRDVRLLLALEPADTVTLLAVLDGEDAITEHRAEAIRLAGDLLTDVRAGEWPPDDALDPADLEVTFADTTTFLARFFPSEADGIARRAAALSVARSLPGLRADNGVNLADLAIQNGISEDRLRAIELEGLRVARVHEAVAYLRVLGGGLTLTAQIGESAPVELT